MAKLNTIENNTTPILAIANASLVSLSIAPPPPPVKKDIVEKKIVTELLTPKFLPQLTKGVKKSKMLIDLYVEYSNTNQANSIEAFKMLLKEFAPEIFEAIQKIGDSAESIESYLEANSKKEISYIEGVSLTYPEDRIFYALRILQVQAHKNGIIKSLNDAFPVKLAEICKVYGVYYDKKKGYDSKQKNDIKALLLNPEGNRNLFKPIHAICKDENGKSIIISEPLIEEMYWDKEINSWIFKMDSRFVLLNQDELKNYWTEDVAARNKYMASLEGGFRNEWAYRLHKYLGQTLWKGKVSKRKVTTLLEECGLNKYCEHGEVKKALSKLQKGLDTMHEVGTLIKNKPVITKSKGSKYGQYLLERL